MIINCYGINCEGWKILNPRVSHDVLGYVPAFLDERDARPAREQFNERYQFGGWCPINGFTRNTTTDAIRYPGDPALLPLAEYRLRDEIILMYPYAIFMIIQKDGTFEVARMD